MSIEIAPDYATEKLPRAMIFTTAFLVGTFTLMLVLVVLQTLSSKNASLTVFKVVCIQSIIGAILLFLGLIVSAVMLIRQLLIHLSTPPYLHALPQQHQAPHIIMLIAAITAPMLTVLFLIDSIKMISLFKNFDMMLPEPTQYTIHWANFHTNPINDIIISPVILIIFVLFMLKDFLLRNKALAHLLNAAVTYCWLIFFTFQYIALALPAIAIVDKMSSS